MIELITEPSFGNDAMKERVSRSRRAISAKKDIICVPERLPSIKAKSVASVPANFWPPMGKRIV